MYKQLYQLYKEASTTDNYGDLDNYLKSIVGDDSKLQSEILQNKISSLFVHHLDKGACKLELIKLFLKYGADLNFVRHKKFPLQLAAQNPNIKLDVVQLLLKYNAHAVWKNDRKGYYKVLKCALRNSDAKPDVVKLLFKHGAKSINGIYWNSLYNPLLLIAVCKVNSSPETINLLLKYGVNVNYKGLNPNTALRCALQMEFINLDVVDTLLLYGADMNIANADGFTPLQCALRNCSAVNQYFIFSNVLGENVITDIYLLREGVGDESNAEGRKQFCLEMCTMSMLKHLVLKKTNCDFALISNSVAEDICETFLDRACCRVLGNHNDVPLLRELLCFLIRSTQEVAKMKQCRLDCCFTLQDFLLNRKTITMEKIAKHMLKILRILNNKSYPIYKDVIRHTIFSVKRKYILLKLENMHIYPIGASGKAIVHQRQVALNFNVISVIAKYLSKKDMFNLLLATEDEEPKNSKQNTKSSNFLKTTFFSFGAKRLKTT